MIAISILLIQFDNFMTKPQTEWQSYSHALGHQLNSRVYSAVHLNKHKIESEREWNDKYVYILKSFPLADLLLLEKSALHSEDVYCGLCRNTKDEALAVAAAANTK